jgi:hypothetical protein
MSLEKVKFHTQRKEKQLSFFNGARVRMFGKSSVYPPLPHAKQRRIENMLSILPRKKGMTVLTT